ncbi:PTPA-CTERM sorting domain-containing protein [Nodosilinea sp. P-1105]|uniref:PTPA-CTERM sorting domain-containing protein n=1 Tax=Nodosilinea sp. P-1105 TaxID=2546229 RepID=UPI00146A5914|nr:PTPA-CTERM sorting domain-containing protein [Nodosilinea sp. P-1105]NMF83017.1 PTPA-CTERM sorting domain-containing protein [Nodosilinea sp. P-1105]
MNIKLTLVAAGAALATFTVSAPAEAISIGSNYIISGKGSFTPNSITFDGSKAQVTSATGDFSIMSPAEDGEFVLAALPSVFDITVPGSGLLVNFKDATSFFGLIETQEIFSFTVNSSKFIAGSNRYQFTGSFGDGTPGIGELAPLETVGQSGVFGYAASFTAVPTPALLPGLIGMGVAALRRKQEEETSEENA